VVPSVRTGDLLQDEIRICADWDLGVALMGADGIPRQPTFLPEHELCGSAARERDRPRMDVGDEERSRMPISVSSCCRRRLSARSEGA